MCKDQSLVARMTAGAGAALLAVAMSAGQAMANEMPEAATKVAAAINQVGGKALGAVTGVRKDETVVLSPYGLGSALHLLLMGAGDKAPAKAKASLRKALLPKGISASRLDESVEKLNTLVLSSSTGKLSLTSANAVYAPKDAPSAPSASFDEFEDRAWQTLKATARPIDFTNSQQAVAEINAWVSESTARQIPSIIEKLDPKARFVLLNAVYFKGAWQMAFDPARTAEADFTRADGSRRKAAMMEGTVPAEHARLDKLQALWLPYAGNEVAMLLIAPLEDAAPGVVKEALAGRTLDALMAEAQAHVRQGPVQVRLPRFRAESSIDLTTALSSQINDALAVDSDYSAINRRKGPLQVLHRAVLEVAESGTIAAAATAITSDRSLAVTPVFSADRPFAFAIVHRPTQAILFAGYVADPGDPPAPAH